MTTGLVILRRLMQLVADHTSKLYGTTCSIEHANQHRQFSELTLDFAACSYSVTLSQQPHLGSWLVLWRHSEESYSATNNNIVVPIRIALSWEKIFCSRPWKQSSSNLGKSKWFLSSKRTLPLTIVSLLLLAA